MTIIFKGYKNLKIKEIESLLIKYVQHIWYQGPVSI